MPNRRHALWFVTMMLLPFYFFGSGRPQIADFLMIPLLGLQLISGARLPQELRRPITRLAVFVMYVATVNVIWAALTANKDFLISTLFYGFNFVIFSGFVYRAYRTDDDFLRWTMNGAAASIVMLAGLAIPFAHRVESGRLELFFFNPNQLAYYIVTMLTIVIALAPRFKPSTFYLAATVLAGMFLELRTGSRAGLLGVTLLIAIYMSRRPILLVFLAAPLLAYLLNADLEESAELWKIRASTLQSSGTEEYLEDRGIDRLISHPKYLALGAGEGFHKRFHIIGQELHSSAANLLFSYGTVGFLLFVSFVLGVVRAGGRRVYLLMVPAFGYSLFHNGLRFRPFWIMLGVFAVFWLTDDMRKQQKQKRKRSRPRRGPQARSRSRV